MIGRLVLGCIRPYLWKVVDLLRDSDSSSGYKDSRIATKSRFNKTGEV